MMMFGFLAAHTGKASMSRKIVKNENSAACLFSFITDLLIKGLMLTNWMIFYRWVSRTMVNIVLNQIIKFGAAIPPPP